MNNPFKILAVDRKAEKREILEKAMDAMHRNTPYDARTIAEAQKNLFSPLARAEAEFMHCLDVNLLLPEADTVIGDDAVPELILLDIFHAQGTA